MLVLDASAAVDLVVRTSASATLMTLIEGKRLLAPHLMYHEALSAISRLERAGRLAADRADAAVRRLEELPVHTIWSDSWITDAWSAREWLRTSDAVYAAAARSLQAPLLTTDARLGRALANRSIGVITVPAAS